LNQTLIRSLNTSIVAIIPIASILIIGGYVLEADTLKDISLALVIGQSIGTYSSIFIAAPSLVALNRKGFRQKRSFLNNESMSIEKSLKVEVATIKYDGNFENSCFTEFSEKQTPLFFTTFFNNLQAWELLWIDSKIPSTVEECNRLVKKKISDRLGGSSYYFLGNLEQNQMYAFCKVTADLVNSDIEVELLASNLEGATSPENMFDPLTAHLHQKGFYRVTYLIPDSSLTVNPMSFSTLQQESVLRKIRLTRTGERADVRIYSSYTE
jgi:hypothetical protein